MGRYGKNFEKLFINPDNIKKLQSWYQFVELGELILNMYNIMRFYNKNELIRPKYRHV